MNKSCNPLLVYCNKILPMVYDESLSYYENICRLSQLLIKTIEEINRISDELDNLEDNIEEITENVINEALAQGKLFIKTNYVEDTKTLQFIFGKVE